MGAYSDMFDSKAFGQRCRRTDLRRSDIDEKTMTWTNTGFLSPNDYAIV